MGIQQKGERYDLVLRAGKLADKMIAEIEQKDMKPGEWLKMVVREHFDRQPQKKGGAK